MPTTPFKQIKPFYCSKIFMGSLATTVTAFSGLIDPQSVFHFLIDPTNYTKLQACLTSFNLPTNHIDQARVFVVTATPFIVLVDRFLKGDLATPAGFPGPSLSDVSKR